MALVLWLLVLLPSPGARAANDDPDRHCRDEDRLVVPERLDDYLVIEVAPGATVVLDCKYCKSENPDSEGREWFFEKRDGTEIPKPVAVDTHEDSSKNRVRINSDNSLVLESFREADAGVYRCLTKDEDRDSEKNKFNYRLEPVAKLNKPEAPAETGNLTDYEEYRVRNLVPVTTRLAYSAMDELAGIRAAGVVLELVSEWGPFGSCENCNDQGQGTRKKPAHCRVKAKFGESEPEPGSDLAVREFFEKSQVLPCRSGLLEQKFPSLFEAVSPLPGFVLVESCTDCNKEPKKKHKKKDEKRRRKGKTVFKDTRVYKLDQGDFLTIPCPEATELSDVVWRKDGLRIDRGHGQSVRKDDPTFRVFADAYFSLILKDFSDPEAGNYSCYVGGEPRLQATIRVKPGESWTPELSRHSAYLSYMMWFYLVAYCVGLGYLYKNPHLVPAPEEHDDAREDEMILQFLDDNDYFED